MHSKLSMYFISIGNKMIQICVTQCVYIHILKAKLDFFFSCNIIKQRNEKKNVIDRCKYA